jgi:hypothetical protein
MNKEAAMRTPQGSVVIRQLHEQRLAFLRELAHVLAQIGKVRQEVAHLQDQIKVFHHGSRQAA